MARSCMSELSRWLARWLIVCALVGCSTSSPLCRGALRPINTHPGEVRAELPNAAVAIPEVEWQ
jgi:hypothetical protein